MSLHPEPLLFWWQKPFQFHQPLSIHLSKHSLFSKQTWNVLATSWQACVWSGGVPAIDITALASIIWVDNHLVEGRHQERLHPVYLSFHYQYILGVLFRTRKNNWNVPYGLDWYEGSFNRYILEIWICFVRISFNKKKRVHTIFFQIWKLSK